MFDIYAAVTDRIIAELEKGIIPWTQPWVNLVAVSTRSSDKKPAPLTPDEIRRTAYSRSTGAPYSLLNQMLLGKPGEYMTFKQCQEAGGKVKKGEKAKMVVFWKMLPVEEEDPLTGEKKTKTVPFLRYYNVFHIDQTEGVTPRKLTEPKLPETPEAPATPALKFNPDEEAERIAADYLTRTGIPLYHTNENQAYYRPSNDSVTMPHMFQFSKVAEYYSTLFHELAHSTGHRSRLNRHNTLVARGDAEYSKEELVAEISSAAILNHIGLETGDSFRNSAAYIQSWLRVLNNDKHMIVGAASRAEKAVALILNI